MGLKRTALFYKQFYDLMGKHFPNKKKQFGNIYFDLRETTDDLIYEHRKEHINRHPFEILNIEKISVVSVIQKINALLKKKTLSENDIKKLVSNFYNIETKLTVFRKRMIEARKSVLEIIDNLDKKLIERVLFLIKEIEIHKSNNKKTIYMNKCYDEIYKFIKEEKQFFESVNDKYDTHSFWNALSISYGKKNIACLYTFLKNHKSNAKFKHFL